MKKEYSPEDEEKRKKEINDFKKEVEGLPFDIITGHDEQQDLKQG